MTLSPGASSTSAFSLHGLEQSVGSPVRLPGEEKRGGGGGGVEQGCHAARRNACGTCCALRRGLERGLCSHQRLQFSGGGKNLSEPDQTATAGHPTHTHTHTHVQLSRITIYVSPVADAPLVPQLGLLIADALEETPDGIVRTCTCLSYSSMLGRNAVLPTSTQRVRSGRTG